MRKSYTYRSQALRFRRWSRKAYAAFISIQRAVTIGQLSFSVADRFEKKNQSLHTGIGMFTDGFFEEDDEERENTEENKRSLAVSHGLFTALLPVLVSNEIAHPAHRVAHYTLYNIVKAGSILSDTSRLSSSGICFDGFYSSGGISQQGKGSKGCFKGFCRCVCRYGAGCSGDQLYS